VAFMQPTAEYSEWLILDTDQGGQVIDRDILSMSRDTLVQLIDRDDNYEKLQERIRDYFGGTRIHSAELQKGWCSRLTAAGYLDSTEWDGPYDTAEEALDACKDLYEVDDNGDTNDS
jgi:hypothetical protein